MSHGFSRGLTSDRLMRFKTVFCWVLTLALLAVSTANAARLTLNDGSVLEGTVIPTADGYWVKLSDGTSKIVTKEDVKSFSGDDGTTSAPGQPAVPPDDASM